MAPIPPVSITAAFRSTRHNAAYIFINNEYVLLDYGPGTSTDTVLNGGRVIRISDGFPSLKDKPFGEHGIDCAFDTHDDNQAYIFSRNQCALLNYAPGTIGDDKILKGPSKIAEIFPGLKGTIFENGIDAAINITTLSNEVYLFKGGQYGRLNYSTSNAPYINTIEKGWYSLAGTIFESGVEAAFATHVPNQAYVFKGDRYARINFIPGTHDDDYMFGKPGRISESWPGIGGVLAKKNIGTKP